MGIDGTMEKINAILADPKDGFQNDIDHLLTRVLAVSTNKITPDPATQKLVFDGVCHFLNTAFGNINIKKFHNTAPNISWEDYVKLPLWSQIANNIYGKNWELFYDKNISGWSCQHWTIVLKKIFDILESKWLSTRNRIMLYNTAGWHSLLIIEFQWKLYVADVFWLNHKYNKIISPLDDFPKEISKNFSRFSFNKKQDQNGKILYLDTTENFIEKLAVRSTKNIALKFKPKLKDAATEVELSINYTGIILELDDTKYRFTLPKWFILPESLPTTHKILDYLFQHLHGNREQKQELQKYLLMVMSKINPLKLYELFMKK